MFLGTHTPRMDDKSRLILPAKFRDELAGGVVITKGQERCLYVFPTTEFATIAAKLREQPVTHKAARAYSRVFFASAHDEVPDKQGRVTIPAHLREYAGLDRELVVIGASTRVEIWDRGAWESYLADSEQEFADIEEGVLPGGL
jgi:MraZ protein